MVNKENINDFLEEIIEQAREINIPVSVYLDNEVIINSRPKQRFGCCRKDDNRFIVEISQFILQGNEMAVKTILAHEVLHTCKGCYEHGALWRHYAALMNQKYGYNIKRITSLEEMGLPENKKSEENIRYVIRCTDCGREFYRQKFTCVMKKINAYRCTCGGKLEWWEVDGK